MLSKRTILLVLFATVYTQINQDARMLALNGSYTTLASGFRAVGINPANLATYQNKSMNIFGFSLGLSNNYFSIDNYNTLSGSHLEDTTDVNYYPKERNYLIKLLLLLQFLFYSIYFLHISHYQLI